MRRHEFQPGRLVAGVALTVAGVLYLLDSSGEADLPWFTVVPLALGGLSLAALVGMMTYAVRRDRRDRIRESSDR
ncbi:hypothetical protein [Streptomyces xanthophaeus]|uniref:Uncharacterized protein n=1 Tax=Streptomyces xanthophaeus TaxID=67385 RepID=A0A919H5L9_9ACTN|nr:hypothetical protein [Streptomyces xanthophaeus]WCD88179.1 hypothetical protein KPP03845_104584 [Streptomyces xanthophaeus]GHI87894.1 hypothetical protein Sxan_52580 [Streptomyces xanthophaeus]